MICRRPPVPLYAFGLLLTLTGTALGQSPVTREVWREAVVSVSDIEQTARFFREIAGYQEKWRGPLSPSAAAAWGLGDGAGGEALLLGPENASDGLLRLVRFDNAGEKRPTRPGARAWDTGCYFSLMARAKDLHAIYDDAIAMGWWTETPITYLEFGASKLNVVIFRGPDGVQVQAYERLAPPLPAEIPPFERLTGLFNIMQMVRNRDASYKFFTQILGFDTFYHGKPYTAPLPKPTPLGIPLNLTTSARYRAAIVYPVAGEFGRMEMIEMMDLTGNDYAERCRAPNLGILAVRYPVDDAQATAAILVERGARLQSEPAKLELAPWGKVSLFTVDTPDGAAIQFFSSQP